MGGSLTTIRDRPADEGLTGLFFSALPYRRVIFQKGGWPHLFPDPTPWQTFRSFLGLFFSRAEVLTARARSLDFLEAKGFRSVVLFGEVGYPLLLARIYDPPPALFYRGALPPGDQSYLAVVGTRNPDRISLKAVDRLALRIRDSSGQGAFFRSCIEPPVASPLDGEPGQLFLFEHLNQTAPRLLNRSGHIVREDRADWRPATVSGLAFGIDERIHLASLRLGIPTVAVLGSGIDRITPTGNAYLIDESIRCRAHLTILSEFFPDDPPRHFSYPRRNRIIAGMAPVTFIMQAGRDSGAMITARYALEEGRDVAAFDHPDLAGTGKNEGARRLLEDGAGRLVLFSGTGG